nr:ABC transporter permease [Clostridium sp. AM45-5]
MNEKKQSTVKRILGTRGMGAVITAFAGLIIIYVAFGLIDRKVFAGQNVMNLLRSMSKYLLIGVGQSYLLITGNIDLSIGSMVGMSAMISATLMAMGVNPFVAMAVAMACCLVTGVINGMLVGKFKLPPFIATLGTMFVTRGVATWSTTTETRMPSPQVSERKQGISSRTSSTMERHLVFTTPSGSLS